MAIALGTAYGMPVLCYIQHAGIPMPQSTDAYGLAIADRIIPAYSIAAILSTVLMVVVSATVVSYLPSRKIAKMLPTEALKGNIQ